MDKDTGVEIEVTTDEEYTDGLPNGDTGAIYTTAMEYKYDEDLNMWSGKLTATQSFRPENSKEFGEEIKVELFLTEEKFSDVVSELSMEMELLFMGCDGDFRNLKTTIDEESLV